MEYSNSNKSVTGNRLVLVASSLALVVGSKSAKAIPEVPEPVKRPKPEIAHTHVGKKAVESCAHFARKLDSKEKVQFGAYKFYLKRGLTPAQSSGIGGNFGQETDWSTDNIAQFGGDRLSAMTRFAERLGRAPTSLTAQLKYTWLELTNGPGAAEDDRRALRDLRASNTVREAATVFSSEYERPGDPQLENRILYGKQILHKFGHLACSDHTGPRARIALPIQGSTTTEATPHSYVN
ncbi:MAG TPA: phage tail tip lysozyme [Candidatus Saccharimonadales bacterium]|nr:phage tail tip lysozyme [Candidatus Saccharimonadales bacterium]